MSDIAINPVTRRVQFTGNTGTGPYAFTFNVLQSSDIVVYKNNVLLTLTTDYTVSISADGTGSVTTVAALVSTDVLTIIGGRELSRTTDFVTAGDLLASSLNEQLDSNVIMSQQLDERFGRTIKAQPGDEDATLDLPLVADRLDKIMLFDTEGNLTASSASDFFTNSVLGGNYIINTATGNGSQTAFGLTSSPSVKTNIQVYIDGVYQNKATFSLSGSTLTFSEAPPLNAAIEFMMGEAVTQITGDASAITYNQGGTGAQDRTVKAKLQETVSVKDFGAVGDGVTDDTAAIQAALIAAADKGQAVFAPAGIYLITDTIYCGPNTYLYGEGTWNAVSADSPVRGTVFKSTTSGIKFFYALALSDLPVGISWPTSSNANSAHSFKLRDLTIWGNQTTQRGIEVGNNYPVTQVGLSNITIRDCQIGVNLVAAYGINISNVYPRGSAPLDTSSKGFQLVGSHTSGSINNCFVFAMGYGMFITDDAWMPGFSINNMDFDGCNYGVAIGDGTGSPNAAKLLNNISFENSIINDVLINVTGGEIGIDGYIQASGSGTTGACINASSTGSCKLYLSNGRIGLVPQGGVASIIADSNVEIYTSNWDTAGTVTTGANKLLDKASYVTGTFTPTLIDTGSGTYTYTSQSGSYTKVGNIVFVSLTIEMATNSGNGDVSVSGLPFEVDGYHMAHSANYGRVSLDSNYSTMGGQFQDGTTTVKLFEVGTGTTLNTGPIAHTQLQGTAYFTLSGTYLTS